MGEPKMIALSLFLAAVGICLLPYLTPASMAAFNKILPVTDSHNHRTIWGRLLALLGISAIVPKWGTLLVGLGIFSIGSSLTRPPVFGMISMLTPAHEQGATMGVAQGVGSLARIVGPIFAASLFVIHAPLPYLICGTLCLLTAFVTMQYLTQVQTAPSPSVG
jgi:hypothetical protein